jgi:DZF domain
LLLQGDVNVQLVVLCAEKPTTSLLKRVVTELPIQLKKISEEHKYTVVMAPVEGAILVSDATITVKVSLTSPLLREQGIYKRFDVFAFSHNFKFIDLVTVEMLVYDESVSISSYQFHRQPVFFFNLLLL